MRFFKAILISSCAFLLSHAHSQGAANTPADSYEKGNVAYESGKYGQAARLYQKSFRDGLVSEDLFYNLGNAHFRQQDYGEAALWYRRALVLDPRMTEARQNLRTLKTRVGLLDFEPSGIDQVISHFREGEIVSLLTVAIWLTLLCLATVLFVKRLRPWRSLFIIASCLFVGLAAASFFGLKIYQTRITVDRLAVITSVDSIAQVSPVPDAKTVIELPPGSEIRIVTDRGPWQYVDIPGDIRGWVKTASLTPLWPPLPPQEEAQVLSIK